MSNPTESWYHERESAWLYRVVASRESDPANRKLFETLATAAEEQAEHWVRLGATGSFHPGVRARIVAMLVRRIGPRAMKSVLIAMKLRGLSVYGGSRPRLEHEMPTSVHEVGRRHRGISGGNNLRAAVFGLSDGLVSNTSLILGVFGSGAAERYILMSGLAGLLAGSLSMAAGEYLSVRSQREMYEHQIGLERDELEEYPEEEAEELALIYQARGLEQDQARALAKSLMANPEQALNTLAREELGLNPDDLASPWSAASFSFVSFFSGALLPMVPFLLPVARGLAVQLSCAVAVASLFAVGLTLSLFNGRSALRGALRMTLIGTTAAACTWLVGHIAGVVMG